MQRNLIPESKVHSKTQVEAENCYEFIVCVFVKMALYDVNKICTKKCFSLCFLLATINIVSIFVQTEKLNCALD